MNKIEYLDRHGKPIDVYNYPENASREALRDYQYAVEVAHERDGLPAEYSGGGMHWNQKQGPRWSWGFYRYRIAAPKIAKGHNPDRLTEEQVGVKDGWRLLEPEEIAIRDNTPLIECWDGTFWATTRVSAIAAVVTKTPTAPKCPRAISCPRGKKRMKRSRFAFGMNYVTKSPRPHSPFASPARSLNGGEANDSSSPPAGRPSRAIGRAFYFSKFVKIGVDSGGPGAQNRGHELPHHTPSRQDQGH